MVLSFYASTNKSTVTLFDYDGTLDATTVIFLTLVLFVLMFLTLIQISVLISAGLQSLALTEQVHAFLLMCKTPVQILSTLISNSACYKLYYSKLIS